MQESEQNHHLFYQYLDEWESQNRQGMIKMEDAFAALQKKINNQEPPVSYPAEQELSGGKVYQFLTTYGIAACVALMIITLNWNTIRYESYETGTSENKDILLADGSVVLLKNHSSLLVPRFSFNHLERNVILKGNAEFDVIHLKGNIPFRVMIGDGYIINVLGTKFSVAAATSDKMVYLIEGKVKLSLPLGDNVYMAPGNLVEINKKSYKLSRPQILPAALQASGKGFLFYNTPLREVAKQFEQVFGVKLVINDPELQNKGISGNYDATTPDELLSALAEIFEIKVEHKVSGSIEIYSLTK